jgi:hypothetical protein
MKKSAMPIWALGLFLVCALATRAGASGPNAFGEFTSSGDVTQLVNSFVGGSPNGPLGQGTFSTITNWSGATLGTTAPTTVYWTFENGGGTPPLLQATPFNTPIKATMSYSATATADNGDYATVSGTGVLAQPYDEVTLAITAVDNGAGNVYDGIYVPPGTTLLRMTSSPANPGGAGTLSGNANSGDAVFDGGTEGVSASDITNLVTFSSAYLFFDNSSAATEYGYFGAFMLSYSGNPPGFTIDGAVFTQFIDNFSDGTKGAFAAEFIAPAPISGTVTLQGCLDEAQPITFQVDPAGGGTSYTQTVTLDSSGNFTLTGIPPGTYNIGAKGASWLQAVVQNVDTTGGSASGVDFTLIAGDINGDNQISLADLLLLLKAYGSTPSSSNWNAAADLNCDGQVSLTDLLLLLKNYGQVGQTLP